MINREFKRVLAMVLSIVFLLLVLSGCNSSKEPETPKEPVTEKSTSDMAESIPEVTLAPAQEKATSEIVQSDSSGKVVSLTQEQKNSLNMLNYLAFQTQEILAKKNSRIYIEQVYSSLINDINPSTVNDYTEGYYDELLDDLHKFESLLKKRERLQYLFEQNQAQAMRNAIPNPIGLLSMVKSVNLASLVSSVVYMAVDAVSSYASGMSSAEQIFLQGSWALDDEESDTIHSLRKQSFMYMVEVVKGYTLPDQLTLSENKVDKLVEWNEKDKAYVSAASRVHFYKKNEADYEGFGQYWLARASAHFDNGEFEECLKAFQRYEDLHIGIYRKDYELAKALPIASGAASQIYDDKTFVEAADRYADLILANTDVKNDWALRYFVAQTYIDVCSRTNDKAYLRKAYEIALENVNELKIEQKKLNDEYIADVKLEPIPAGTPDSKKKEIEDYNRQKQAERQIELPPVYEPLKLNLDLLYALSGKLELTETEKKNTDAIIYANGNSLFLSVPLNDTYHNPGQLHYPEIQFTGRDIKIQADHLTPNAAIVAYLNEGEDKGIFNDWIITNVERKNKNNVSSYIATYHSKSSETYDFKKAQDMTIYIYSTGAMDTQVYSFTFKINNSKEWIFFDKSEFNEIER